MEKYLIGEKFNHLTILEYFGISKHRQHMVKCKCDCGEILVVVLYNVKSGHTKSCGCLKKGINILGKKFNKLTVVSYNGKNKRGETLWLCKCDCGNEIILVKHSIISSNTKSCGCARTISNKLRSRENSPLWKGGSPLSDEIRSFLKRLNWPKQIFERDDYICVRCSKQGGNLNAHHIKMVKYIISDNDIMTINEAKECGELLDIDNGATLCEVCHNWVHTSLNINKEFIEGRRKRNGSIRTRSN